MKRFLIFAVFLLACVAPTVHAAEGGLYLGLYGGGSLVNDARNDSSQGSFNFDFKPGYLGMLTLGYDLREEYPAIGVGRVELEAAYRGNELDEIEYEQAALGTQGDVKVSSLMLNSFGEYRSALPMIPYVGVGIGIARMEMDGVRFDDLLLIDDSDIVFAWQVGAGVGYFVSRYVALDLGYRFFSAVEPRFRDIQGMRFESEYETHEVLLGIRLDF